MFKQWWSTIRASYWGKTYILYFLVFAHQHFWSSWKICSVKQKLLVQWICNWMKISCNIKFGGRRGGVKLGNIIMFSGLKLHEVMKSYLRTFENVILFISVCSLNHPKSKRTRFCWKIFFLDKIQVKVTSKKLILQSNGLKNRQTELFERINTENPGMRF